MIAWAFRAGFAHTFAYHAANAKVPGVVDWVATRSGNLVTLAYAHRDEHERYVADLSMGGNLVTFERHSDARGFDQLEEWQYENRGGAGCQLFPSASSTIATLRRVANAK